MRRRDGVSTWHRACEEAGVRYAPSPRHFVVGWPSVGVPGPCRPMCGMSAMLARAGRIPSPRPSHRCADVETAPNHIFPCFAPRYVSRGRCLRRASSRGPPVHLSSVARGGVQRVLLLSLVPWPPCRCSSPSRARRTRRSASQALVGYLGFTAFATDQPVAEQPADGLPEGLRSSSTTATFEFSSTRRTLRARAQPRVHS